MAEGNDIDELFILAQELNIEVRVNLIIIINKNIFRFIITWSLIKYAFFLDYRGKDGKLARKQSLVFFRKASGRRKTHLFLRNPDQQHGRIANQHASPPKKNPQYHCKSYIR